MDKWLQNNNVIKLIALALAIMLWLLVSDTSLPIPRDRQGSTTIKNVTLEPRYNEERFSVVEMPDRVDLSLRGDEFSLNRISPERYKAYVDLKKLEAGRHQNVPVKVSGLPGGLEVEIRPSKVNVVIEEKQQKEMPVEVDVIGKPDPDYKVGEPMVKPGRVLVRGPESLLEQVNTVKAFVNTQGAKSTIHQSVSLQAYGETGVISEAEVKPEVVDVTVPVASPNAVVPLKVEIGAYPPEGYAIKDIAVNSEEVTVYGSKGYVEGLKYYPTPKLDLSKSKSDKTYQLPIKAIDEAVKVEPDHVEIKVDIVKGKTKKLKNVPIKVKGEKAELVSTDTVNITLYGAPSLLKKISRGDVEAIVDTSNLTAGTHQVPVQVSLPAYIQIQGEPKAEVRVTE
ncbi:hypothetical protein GXN76_14475 [Kroppenstedtia pulmonis]|uniref:YbbR-like domain-containing protein n=1 Tax=Kroppenstedtia pulmonis TaxID=1380685 RepID=A0A7D3XKE0_9BACL|nr:CdaR family protein [Kroppenstedtia pulmonis]QKG85539.1 hypothetical protein GXN76_14475 [Kroppenstedtia pulmonis]